MRCSVSEDKQNRIRTQWRRRADVKGTDLDLHRCWDCRSCDQRLQSPSFDEENNLTQTCAKHSRSISIAPGRKHTVEKYLKQYDEDLVGSIKIRTELPWTPQAWKTNTVTSKMLNRCITADTHSNSCLSDNKCHRTTQEWMVIAEISRKSIVKLLPGRHQNWLLKVSEICHITVASWQEIAAKLWGA